MKLTITSLLVLLAFLAMAEASQDFSYPATVYCSSGSKCVEKDVTWTETLPPEVGGGNITHSGGCYSAHCTNNKCSYTLGCESTITCDDGCSTSSSSVIVSSSIGLGALSILVAALNLI